MNNTFQYHQVPSKHLDEVSRFLSLNDSHLYRPASQLLVVDPSRVYSAGSSLVYGAVLSLPEVDDVPTVPVAVQDHVAVSVVQIAMVGLGHLQVLVLESETGIL